jgi:hypothetical protein
MRNTGARSIFIGESGVIVITKLAYLKYPRSIKFAAIPKIKT